MSSLASDLNNPNFAGAVNPDSLLHVEFYQKEFKNEFKSQETGKPVFYTVDMVRIMTPGNQLNIVDTFAQEHHKQRFPIQWVNYQNSLGNSAEAKNAVGTPLAEWPAISRSEAEEYRARKFYTVEQIAGASDQQIQSLGMNAYSLRERAKAFLAQANNTALAQHQAAELAKRDLELKELKEQMARMSAQMNQMTQNQEPRQKRKYTKRAKPETQTNE